MVKRSRLRSDRRGKGRLFFVLALTVIILFMGRYFFSRGHGEPEVQETNRIFQDSLLSDRGVIYDRNFQKLAVTTDKVSVYVNVRDVEENEVAEKVAPLLRAPSALLRQTIHDAQFKAWLARNISREEEEKIIALGIPGLFSLWEKVRYYPQQKRAAHLIGYVGKNTGLSGVEYYYNALLNHYGDELAALVGDEVENVKGVKKSLTLTVDLHIQQYIETILQDFAAIEPDGKYIALFVELTTGAVIAVGHYPSFNPNSFNEEDSDALEKIMVHRDVLKNLLVEPIAVPSEMKKLMRDVSLLSEVDRKGSEGLPWSVVGEGRNNHLQQTFFKSIGLYEPVTVDWIKQLDEQGLSAKKIGSTKDNFAFESIPAVTTPLHLVRLLACILTGKIPPLHVVDVVTDRDGRSFQVSAEKKELLIPAHMIEEVRKMMRNFPIVERGLYAMFEMESTGVARRGNYSSFERNRMYFNWYPKEKPRLMFFAFAELPSVSVARKKMKGLDMESVVSQHMMSMITRQGVFRSLVDSVEIEEKEQETFTDTRVVGQGFSSPDDQLRQTVLRMPDVRKMNLRKSLQQLEELRLDIRVQGTGTVVEQNPLPGTEVKQGDVCTLILQSYQG